jgi:2-oxoglutarate dehydrogenase E2 component (dihydrolipoamide succinyltransferase)
MIGEGAGVASAPPPKAQPLPAATKPVAPAKPAATTASAPVLSPSARKIAEDNNVSPSSISGTGRDGRVMKGDVLAALETRASEPRSVYVPPSGPRPQAVREERVTMSRLRRTIALRLKEAQNTAAMLTTFNEVDMSAVMQLRAAHKDLFEKRHGVRLGFMSFFVKACIVALKEIPSVNAEIEGDDIVYKNYYDLGVAVGTERGLVVPVIRGADELSLADIEKRINDFGLRARDNKLKLEELQGGTFTISNGGVYGSLMSTPILNVPQSGILGMHKIEQRPVAIDGKVEIRPMMYLALSYDHRIVDGKEAVTFLVRVKECLEAPERMILEV